MQSLLILNLLYFAFFSKIGYTHFGEKQISACKLLFFFCQKCNKVGICLQILFKPMELSNLCKVKFGSYIIVLFLEREN